MRFKTNEVALVRVRVMARCDEFGQTEWVCQPILSNGKDCPNSVVVTAPDEAVVSIPEAVASLTKRRKDKGGDQW